MAKHPGRVVPMKKRRAVLRTHATPADVATVRLWVALLQRGEDPRPALVDAIEAGVVLPDDVDGRRWVADILRGARSPKRARGRPRTRHRPTLQALARAKAIADRVEHWRCLFAADRRRAEDQVRRLATARVLAAADPNRLIDTLNLSHRQMVELQGRAGRLLGTVLNWGKPSDVAARVVAWELTRPSDPLTVAVVRERVTRERARRKSK